MMSLSISDALHQAQEAMNGGDYSSATATCSRLVGQFPGYVEAYRLLAEAYRELGQPSEAQQAYTAALMRHQRHPSAYSGLGMLAEEQGSADSALAYCQVAWELDPGQQHLRETLSRVAMRRYASDGEIQFSRAALAQLHASASRLHRAVAEYRAALTALPERVDLQLGLAETLWRLGQDAEATRLATAVLDAFPESAPALVVLADIEHKAGNRRADDLLRRLRAVDPDGTIVASMLENNPRADRAWLEVPTAAVPWLREDAPAISIERPKIAPAPDFEYQPIRSEIPVQPVDIDALAPISLDELGAGDIPADIEPISLEELGGLPEGFQPFNPSEFGDDLPVSEAPVFDFSSLDTAAQSIVSEEPAALVDLGFEDFSEQPFVPSEQSSIRANQSASPTDNLQMQPEPSWELPILDEDLPQVPATTTPASMATDSKGLDDLSALAAALEGDVAEALARAGEPVPATEVDVEASRPPQHAPSGYTTMLQSLDDAGLAPFDPLGPMADPFGTPPSVLAPAAPVAPTAPSMSVASAETLAASAASSEDIAGLTDDWDSIDDEILRAVPGGVVRGYTDQLRSLSEIGLAPFEVEEAEDDIEGVTPFNPFSAEPIAPAPVRPPVPPVAQPAPAPADTVAGGATSPAEDDLLVGLQPFAFEEFDQPAAAAAQPSAFTLPQPGWEGASGSAVPSDEDLDALLALGEEAAGDDFPIEPPTVEVPVPLSHSVTPPDRYAFDDASIADETMLLAPRQERDEVESISPATPTRRTESDLLRTIPGLDEADIDFLLQNSVAVTRELEQEPAVFSQHVPTMQPTTTPEPIAPMESMATPVVQPDAVETLRPGTELFHRARRVKDELVSEGIIGGMRELEEEITTSELIARQDSIPTQQLPDPMPVQHAPFAVDDDEDDLPFPAMGVTRDTTMLRAALEVTPEDDELHWWLAEALRERGEMVDAYHEYRWLIRNAPSRHDDILHALNTCVERDQEPETAHRLLGDIYRRRGDVTRASSHAAAALQARRRAHRVQVG